jgi:hypothetical protein
MLDQYIAELALLIQEIKKLQETSKIIIPSPGKIEKELSDYVWFSQALDSLRMMLNRTRILESASKIIIPEYAEVQNLIEDLSKTMQYNDSLNESRRAVKKFESLALGLAPTDALSVILFSVEEKIKDASQFNTLTDDFISLVKNVKGFKTDLEKDTENLTKLQKEYSEYKICPLCERPL